MIFFQFSRCFFLCVAGNHQEGKKKVHKLIYRYIFPLLLQRKPYPQTKHFYRRSFLHFLSCSYSMNSRDLVVIATATIFGALASALAFRFCLFVNPKKHYPQRIHSSQNGVASKKFSSLDPFDPSKREGYLSWDDYFMAMAFLSAERSKDPNRQVGACLVSQNGVILGIGYNGFPRGCSDDKLPWAKKSKTGDPLETKYPYVCHAEVNAILNTNHASAAGQKLYVTMFPCNECTKIIIQSGVAEVIYFVEKRLNDSDVAYIASHKLLSMAGVKVRKHQPQMNQILIKFEKP